MAKSKLYITFLILIGIVVGTLVGNLCAPISWLSWLAFGIAFGMEAPFILNLGVMQITFGLSLNLTLAVVIFVILSIIIGRAIVK